MKTFAELIASMELQPKQEEVGPPTFFLTEKQMSYAVALEDQVAELGRKNEKLTAENKKMKQTLLEVKEAVYKHVFIQDIINKTLGIVR